jgi:hypothetical protein
MEQQKPANTRYPDLALRSFVLIIDPSASCSYPSFPRLVFIPNRFSCQW